MSLHSEQQPSFTEVRPGVFIATGVASPKYLAIRDGQNILDQPPYSWLLTTPDLLDSQWDESAETKTKLARTLLRVMVKKYRNLPVKFYTTSVDREKKFGEVNIKGGLSWFKDVVKTLLRPKLELEIDTQQNADSISLLRTINTMYYFLAEYPFSSRYLLEHLVSREATLFDFFGDPLPVRADATFQVATYAEYARHKMSLDKNWSSWLGLTSELPDDSASLLQYGGSNSDGLGQEVPIVKISSDKAKTVSESSKSSR